MPRMHRSEAKNVTRSNQIRPISIRHAALWISMILAVALSLWCLLVPYWHIHDRANVNYIVRSERRALWNERSSDASMDVVFTLIPAGAFAIIAVVLGFSLHDGDETAPPAAKPQDEPVLRK
jgi:ABC-type Fe3+ transport system permease subunit